MANILWALGVGEGEVCFYGDEETHDKHASEAFRQIIWYLRIAYKHHTLFILLSLFAKEIVPTFNIDQRNAIHIGIWQFSLQKKIKIER